MRKYSVGLAAVVALSLVVTGYSDTVRAQPGAVEDARCALRWVYRNQKQYNFDVRKIVTSGQSAGGHLSLTTGMLPASAGMDNTCPGDRTGNASNPGPTNSDELKVAAIVDQ